MFFGQPLINVINDFLIGMETAIIVHVGHLVFIIGIIAVPFVYVSFSDGLCQGGEEGEEVYSPV